MRETAATKREAVKLIQAAMKAGWSREIETSFCCGQRISTVVTLRKHVGPYDWAFIIVSFRLPYSFSKGSRWSVAISTVCNYETKTQRGLSPARYQLFRLSEKNI
jgi:hypothetical protein